MAVAAGLVAWLASRLAADGTFRRLIDEPKHWGYLVAAQGLIIGAFVLNYLRWFLLVRALDLPFAVADALRLGSLGFLMSQILPSSVGGDLLKAAAVAHEQPGRRTEAIATVVIDRVVGVYGMLLVACLGQLIAGGEPSREPIVRSLIFVVRALAVLGTAGIALLMTPPLTGPAMQQWAGRLPMVGETARRLFAAASAYRNERRYLFAAIAIACGTHFMFATAFWLMGRGLPVDAPPLRSLLLMSPLSLSAGALPFTPGGLGLLEGTMGKLYEAFGFLSADGYLVGFTFRAMTYVLAALGGLYYAQARRNFDMLIHEAEELAEDAS